MAYFDVVPTSREDFDALLKFTFDFSRIPDVKFEEHFFSLVRTLNYHRSEVLQYENKVSERAYFIAKGLVFAFFYNRDQEIVAFRIFKEGEVAMIPDSFMNGKVAEYSLMTCADTRLLEITRANAFDLYQTFPLMVMLTVQLLGDISIKDMDRDKVLSLGRKGSITRFYELYPELYGNTSFQFRDMYIARFLNMNPVTFSRLRRKLFPNYPGG